MFNQIAKDLFHFLRVPHIASALFVALLIRWLMSSTIPLGHDETYYWDWGRHLQWSYYDHPPGVAWLSWLGQFLGGSLLAARFWPPLIHLAATLVLVACTTLMAERSLSKQEAWILFGSTQLSPILSAGGIMLLPDIGLIFFMSVFLLLVFCLALTKDGKAGMGIFILMGLSGGLAFCFKYHAAPMVSGSMLCLLWLRRVYFKKEFLGWIASVISGLFAIIPVLYWNSQHQWISFFYQSQHGFGGLEFHFDWLLRILIAVPLLAGPFLCFMIIRQFFIRWRNSLYFILGSCIIPLSLLLLVLSAFKEVLPHWIMPCIWLGIPAAVLAVVDQRYWRWNFFYGGFVLLILFSLLAPANIRNQLPEWLDDKPGGLGQITIWTPLVEYLERIDYRSAQHFSKQKFVCKWLTSCQFIISENIADENNGTEIKYIQRDKMSQTTCFSEPQIVSLRWYWVAQLAFNLPGQPKVLDFDPNHLSYYSFRDQNLELHGCRVIVIGDSRSFNSNIFYKHLDVYKVNRFKLRSHQDREIIILWGRINANPPSMLWINEDKLSINKSLVSERYDSLDINKKIHNYK